MINLAASIAPSPTASRTATPLGSNAAKVAFALPGTDADPRQNAAIPGTALPTGTAMAAALMAGAAGPATPTIGRTMEPTTGTTDPIAGDPVDRNPAPAPLPVSGVDDVPIVLYAGPTPPRAKDLPIVRTLPVPSGDEGPVVQSAAPTTPPIKNQPMVWTAPVPAVEDVPIVLYAGPTPLPFKDQPIVRTEPVPTADDVPIVLYAGPTPLPAKDQPIVRTEPVPTADDVPIVLYAGPTPLPVKDRPIVRTLPAGDDGPIVLHPGPTSLPKHRPIVRTAPAPVPAPVPASVPGSGGVTLPGAVDPPPDILIASPPASDEAAAGTPSEPLSPPALPSLPTIAMAMPVPTETVISDPVIPSPNGAATARATADPRITLPTLSPKPIAQGGTPTDTEDDPAPSVPATTDGHSPPGADPVVTPPTPIADILPPVPTPTAGDPPIAIDTTSPRAQWRTELPAPAMPRPEPLATGAPVSAATPDLPSIAFTPRLAPVSAAGPDRPATTTTDERAEPVDAATTTPILGLVAPPPVAGAMPIAALPAAMPTPMPTTADPVATELVSPAPHVGAATDRISTSIGTPLPVVATPSPAVPTPATTGSPSIAQMIVAAATVARPGERATSGPVASSPPSSSARTLPATAASAPATVLIPIAATLPGAAAPVAQERPAAAAPPSRTTIDPARTAPAAGAPAAPPSFGPTVPAPAAIVFGAAIAAAQEQDRRAATGTSATTLDLVNAGVIGVDRAGAAPAAPPAAATVDTTDVRWPQAMISRIEHLRDAVDATDTRIRLLPDALGTIDVAVRRDGDTVHVHFTADQPQTRALLLDATPRLADAAEQRGLRLGQTSVDTATSGGAGSNEPRSGATGQSPGGQGQPRQPASDPRRPAAFTPAQRRVPADTADDARIA